jgi:hypothetical protein
MQEVDVPLSWKRGGSNGEENCEQGGEARRQAAKSGAAQKAGTSSAEETGGSANTGDVQAA